MYLKKVQKENIYRFFQHFPSLSRNQDYEGNNTPASDDRGGRNFHLPNICTSIFPIRTKLFFKFIFQNVFANALSHPIVFFKHLLFAPFHLCWFEIEQNDNNDENKRNKECTLSFLCF
jgi:hypothetical protein